MREESRFLRSLILVALVVTGCSASTTTTFATSSSTVTTVATAGSSTVNTMLIGAWEAIGIREEPGEGEIEPFSDVRSYIVFHADQSFAMAFVPTDELLTVEDACRLEPFGTWQMMDETRMFIDLGNGDIDWEIVALDENSLVFEEGTDEFIHSRLGECQ